MPTYPSTMPMIEPTPNSQTTLRIREAIARPLVSALSSWPGMNLPRSGPEVGLSVPSCRGRLGLWAGRVSPAVALLAERLAQEAPQFDALLGVQGREDLVLHPLHPLLRELQRSHAGRCELDDVSPTIVGVPATLREPGALDLVEHQHEVVRVEMERPAERLLGDGAAV